MHQQRLQIVPALGSSNAAPRPWPLLSRGTLGPRDRQQKKPGLRAASAFLYSSLPPARPLRTRLLPFRSLGEASRALSRGLETRERAEGRGSSQRLGRSSLVRPSPVWVLARVPEAPGVTDAAEQPAIATRAVCRAPRDPAPQQAHQHCPGSRVAPRAVEMILAQEPRGGADFTWF